MIWYLYFNLPDTEKRREKERKKEIIYLFQPVADINKDYRVNYRFVNNQNNHQGDEITLP